MESPSIHVPFALEPGKQVDDLMLTERIAFWDSATTIQWFRGRGYTLYQRIMQDDEPSQLSHPTFPVDINHEFVQAEYPFAHHDTDTVKMSRPWTPMRALDCSGKLVFAQDSSKRHVAIKIIQADTDEYRILRFLSEQSSDILKYNCVIPVLELLPAEGFWFAVMPRWGIPIYNPKPRFLFEVVDIIHSLLKGLNFLHENNIAHGDIKLENMVVNHFNDMMSTEQERRNGLRYKRCLLYALVDFNFSIMLPPGADRTQFRLPYHRSWGSFNLCGDASCGEYDYSPFILDIGAMGVSLCDVYQYLSKDLPLLAPLLDMMTTWDTNRRFTASEALRFFEECLSELSEKDLSVPINLHGIEEKLHTQYNRWEGLSSYNVERWKSYRVQSMPWHLRMLRFIHLRSGMSHLLPKTRLFFHRLSSIPRQLYGWVFPSKIAI